MTRLKHMCIRPVKEDTLEKDERKVLDDGEALELGEEWIVFESKVSKVLIAPTPPR